MFDNDLFGGVVKPEQKASVLAKTWEYPPFSVLNAREGWWQERKRAWLALGIKSEVGRGENLLRFSDTINEPDPAKRKANNDKRADARAYNIGMSGRPENGWSKQDNQGNGTSIFDPVLCELNYRWFCPPGGVILDPFAGGSVRGIVASVLGREYHGVELRAEQVAANRAQAHIGAGPSPRWYCADSRDIDSVVSVQADMVFSCPPYADLEVYSDDPRDISTMAYDDFLTAYRAIIAAACGKLKMDSFACFVVGEVRNKRGNYRNFVGDTVESFRAAGLHYYNEAILVTAIGSLPIRANKQFQAARKLGKTHQNVLVFVKGDGKKAASVCSA